jgi:recombination protein RecA
MDKRLKKVIDLVKEKTGANIHVASEMTDFTLLDTPFPSLNSLIGGIPLGRFTTIAGPQHSGKGVFLLQLIAHHMQKDPDFMVLWTDAENAFDLAWAEKMGVDLERIIIQKYDLKNDIMENLLDQSLKIIKDSKLISMWVIDSIGALVPKGDIYDSSDKEKSLEGLKMLNLPVKLGEFFRKANVLIAPDEASGYKGCAVVSIGQIYTVPGDYAMEEVKGGNAFKHWAHLRIMFRRGPKSDWPEQVEIIGLDGAKRKVFPGWGARLRVDKTRINDKEGQEILLTFMLGRGFDSEAAVISAAFGFGLFPRAGAFYSSPLLPEGKMRGKENVIKYLTENKDIYAKMVEELNRLALESHVVVAETKETEENIV